MTTLAVIGSGILGSCLAFSLAKERKNFTNLTLFSSDSITPPCTLSSTAVAAARGVTPGHSKLGDKLHQGFLRFSKHVKEDQPKGVQQISQITVATEKLDQFKKRYPESLPRKDFLKTEQETVSEDAFLIETDIYTNWLQSHIHKNSEIVYKHINDFIVEIRQDEKVHLTTHSGKSFSFDHVICAGGNYNRFWKELDQTKKLYTSKPVQGSYFEFNQLNWSHPSFSLTIDGDNIVWNQPKKRLFVGSTSLEASHFLAPHKELIGIFNRLNQITNLDLPPFKNALIKVGLREKAQKREPYIISNNNLHFIGGVYKNAFVLSLLMSEELVSKI